MIFLKVFMATVKLQAVDRSTMCSILNNFGQRSQYIYISQLIYKHQILIPLHKQSGNP